jgi:hypothetical protein
MQMRALRTVCLALPDLHRFSPTVTADLIPQHEQRSQARPCTHYVGAALMALTLWHQQKHKKLMHFWAFFACQQAHKLTQVGKALKAHKLLCII